AAGQAALAAAAPRTARRHLGSAAKLARGQALLVRLRGHLAQALEAATGRDSSEVLRHCRTGLTDLARYRAALPSMELRMLASGHGVELSQLGLRELLRGAPPTRLFSWMELTRAASLLFVELPAGAVEEELTALRAVEHELRWARREQDREPAELLARRARLEAQIRRTTWTGQQGLSATGRLVGGRGAGVPAQRPVPGRVCDGRENAGRSGHRCSKSAAGRAGADRAGSPGNRHAAFRLAAAAQGWPARAAGPGESRVLPGCAATGADNAARCSKRRPACGRSLRSTPC